MVQMDLGSFGDARRRRVGARLLSALCDRPGSCVRALAEDRNEANAFEGFLDNPSVSHEEMLTASGRHTAERARDRHVLVINDTTELSFATHTGKKQGFGRSGNNAAPGLFLHPSVAIEADGGGVIGLVGMKVLNRTHALDLPAQQRAFEDKESHRWLSAAAEAGDVLSGAASVTMVGDRESDIYELYARRPAGVHLLTRASKDRCLEGGVRLFATVDGWPERHHTTIEIPALAKRAARTASVVLRFGRVCLLQPDYTSRRLAPRIETSVIDVVELDAPAGVVPLHWRLLSTHEVSTVAQAQEIVRWYRLRWTIEQVFRTVKSAALEIDTSQLTQVRRFIKFAVAAMIAAVRVMQLVVGRDGQHQQDMADAIDPKHAPALTALSSSLEGRTEKLRNPHPASSLAWLSWIVARLAGWSGYTSRGYRPPGPKTIARGITRLDGFLKGWEMANRSEFVRLP